MYFWTSSTSSGPAISLFEFKITTFTVLFPFHNYKQVAEDTLKEKNKITETLTLTVLGDYKMKKGTITPIKNEKLGIDNYYSIKNSSHSISGKKETVSIGVEIFDL